MLNRRIFNFELDILKICPPIIKEVGCVKELDGTTFIIALKNGDRPFDLNGCIVRLFFKRPDGFSGFQKTQIQIMENGIVTIDCIDEIFEMIGDVVFEVEIADMDGYIETTPEFKIKVIDKLGDDSNREIIRIEEITLMEELKDYVIQSSEYIDSFKQALSEIADPDYNTLLEALISTKETITNMAPQIQEQEDKLLAALDEVTQKEFDFSNSEDIREASEATRIQNEIEREANENQRKNFETDRNNRENERILNETSRFEREIIRETEENKRILNEEARMANEEARQMSEDTRNSNEESRKTFELLRISSELKRTEDEAARGLNEENRNDSEVLRNSNEETRVMNETTRVSEELVREVSEEQRVINENARKNYEESRVLSEQTRENNENNRQLAESNREQKELEREQQESQRQLAIDEIRAEVNQVSEDLLDVPNNGNFNVDLVVKGNVYATNDGIKPSHAGHDGVPGPPTARAGNILIPYARAIGGFTKDGTGVRTIGLIAKPKDAQPNLDITEDQNSDAVFIGTNVSQLFLYSKERYPTIVAQETVSPIATQDWVMRLLDGLGVLNKGEDSEETITSKDPNALFDISTSEAFANIPGYWSLDSTNNMVTLSDGERGKYKALIAFPHYNEITYSYLEETADNLFIGLWRTDNYLYGARINNNTLSVSYFDKLGVRGGAYTLTIREDLLPGDTVTIHYNHVNDIWEFYRYDRDAQPILIYQLSKFMMSGFPEFNNGKEVTKNFSVLINETGTINFHDAIAPLEIKRYSSLFGYSF